MTPGLNEAGFFVVRKCGSIHTAKVKRDMETIRRILTEVESSETALTYDSEEEAYQVQLLEQEGFLDAKIVPGPMGTPRAAIVFGMTWKGHDFLDAARDDTLWKKAK